MISRADLHIHTTFSDGTLAPEDVLNYYAVHPEISVVAITDHDTLDGALRVRDHRERHLDVYHGVDVIVGQEVSSRDGHIVGLFLERWVPPGLSAADTVAHIHAQGGLAVAVHPYTHLMEFAGLKGVGNLIGEVPFDAVETRNSNITELYTNWWAARQARQLGLCAVGSSDGHFDDSIGLCYTLFEGNSAAELQHAIRHKQTRAAGHVYGPATLSRYIWRRWRAGQSILPGRSAHLVEHAPSNFHAAVSDRSSLSAVVLQCHGGLTFEAAPLLKEKLVLVAEAGIDIILNLAEVSHLDAGGATCLIAGRKAAERHGRRFSLVSLSGACRQVLATARLSDAFDIYDSETSALEALLAPEVAA